MEAKEGVYRWVEPNKKKKKDMKEPIPMAVPGES
jgi:hypothetical protein